MMRSAGLIALVIAPLTISISAPVSVAAVPETAAEPSAATVAEVVQARVGATRLPGVAVAVVHDGRVVHVAGYGHGPGGEPVDENTPMRLGGASESFTATALAQLAGPGFVPLDDPVVAHLPEFTTADPRSARITVRQLLDHTSGLPATVPAGEPRSLEEAVAGLRDVTLVAEPGERRVRSEAGYQVAARLLEVRTKRPFAESLHDRVLFQTGMLDTAATAGTRDPVPGLVDGHDRFLGLSRAQQEPDRFVNGSGGIVAPAQDVATWLGFNAGYGLRTVLAGDGLREVQRLGWEDRSGGAGPPELWLRGRTATSSATLVLLPDTRYGVAVLANSREPLDAGTGAGPSEVDALAADLVALTRGDTPAAPGPPIAFLAELLLVAVAMTAMLVAAVALLRSGRWARRFAGGGLTPPLLRLLPYLLPLVLLAFLPRLAAPLVGGGTFADLAEVWLTALVAAEVVAACGLVVAAARLRALVRVSPRTAR
ncbi:serine hydrolase domain-containing protein [Pseudonocardia zijingensis]|jgi:CubicO group peptidase (beta-lactamase class C family)|uniref:Serine hydrolase domain-containing protein n=1 Tax=Pseudonocardia zijingensis TaxID=153376 RepID=A0ABP4AZK3_9PSEU